MRWLNDLKIRKKLLLAFGVLISLMVVMTIYSVVQFTGIEGAYRNLTESTSRRQTNLADALEILALLRINNISTAYPITDNAISKSLLSVRRLDYEALCDTFLDYLYKYREHLFSDKSILPGMMPYRIGYVNEIGFLFVAGFKPCYYKIRDGILELNNTGVSEGILEEYNTGTELTTLLNDLREMEVDYNETEVKRITAFSARIVYTQSFVALGIIIFSILASLFMARKLEMPVYALKAAATEIARGNLNFPIRCDRKDEFGNLFNRIGDMVDSLKNATQAKSAFLANMSHDMRTPLNVVVGLTNLRLEDTELGAEIRDDLLKINSAGELLLGLVNDVLDISKIEAGKFELIPVEYDTASLLNDIITLNMIRIQSKPINLKLDISESLPSELFGDELRIKQILNNLLSNAFKYTREGTVTLQVGCSVSEDNRDVLVSITVSDTGIGIRPDDLKKIFTDYNQVDTNANRKIEGTGLGLSIVKRLVKMMEGEITVESEYGKGSSFHVNIKQGLVNEKTIGHGIVENLRNFCYTTRKQHVSATLIRADLSYVKVLVVDDYQTNLDVAEGMLRKYKMNVDCVTSGQAAIDLIRRGEPVYDAVFMDHMMPGMDGIEATRWIRNLSSEYARTIPIVALTANALAGNEQMFLNNGFSAFLSKPINILELDSIIRRWIRKKERESSAGKALAGECPAETKITAPSIPGINMEAGLEVFSGDMELYEFILGSFLTHTPETVEKMQIVTKESLADYAIDVHSIKSVSATIGAEDINKRAKNLEAMAKAGDLPGVLALNGEFLKDTETLLSDVKDWLKKRG